MSIHGTLLIGLPALAAGLAAAQTAPAAPSNPAAPAYTSAFEGYRPFAAEEVQDWRKSNDTVREIGGWRAYAREIHGQGAAHPRPPASAPQGQASAGGQKDHDPHAGHHR
jgi:hypothetical protein